MFKGWRHSLTLRLALAFALLATLVFAALGLYFSRAADRHMAELDTHDLHGKLALIAHFAASEASAKDFSARLDNALVGEHGLVVAIDDAQGAVFRWPDTAVADVLSRAAVVPEQQAQNLHLDNADYRVLAIRLERAWGDTVQVVIARDIRHHTAFLEQLRADFRLAVLAAALLTALVGVAIARRGLAPVRAIARAAGRISAGQLAERIPEQNVPPELAELVHAFNAMLGRLEESFTRLADFSADLAHELRTPIHSLRMQTEVSLGKPRSVEEYRDLLASSLEEYERLSRIIADMLFLAKADHGLVMPHQEQFELRALCGDLIEYYGLLADNVSLTLVGEALTVNGDRLMLQRAIGNLLVNAINHAPPAGWVRLALATQGAQAQISVSNSGTAIPTEAQEHIFDRFVRLEQNHEGSGLGLAITRSIVTAHGGSVAVHSDAQATEFVIYLPMP